MKEYFRGVIWPRGLHKEGEKTVYRYPIVGMLITDEPIENIEGIKNADGISENFLDGNIHGLADALSFVEQRETSRKIIDASDVLTSLDSL